MAHFVIIARLPDGLILAETHGHAHGPPVQGRREASELLKRLAGLSPRCSVAFGSSVFHITQGDGVCFLAAFDVGYPRNYAFAFLEDVQAVFQEELKREFGTGSVDYRSHIDTIEKPYHFVRLDRTIARKKAEYADPSSSRSLSRLHASFIQVSGIRQHNIEEFLCCGDPMEDAARKARLSSSPCWKHPASAKRMSVHDLPGKLGNIIVLFFVVASVYRIGRFEQSISTLIGFVLVVSMMIAVSKGLGRPRANVNASDKLKLSMECHADAFP